MSGSCIGISLALSKSVPNCSVADHRLAHIYRHKFCNVFRILAVRLRRLVAMNSTRAIHPHSSLSTFCGFYAPSSFWLSVCARDRS